MRGRAVGDRVGGVSRGRPHRAMGSMERSLNCFQSVMGGHRRKGKVMSDLILGRAL